MVDYTGKTIYLGIDVHKKTYSMSVICDGILVKRDTIAASPQKLLNYLSRGFKGAEVKSAYEAGFCGFYLHRFLVDHGIDNIVVHAASIEISARDAVKTDKRDSLKIATQLSDRRLTCVYIPSVEREDKRNLTRLREALVKQKTRTGCQLKSLLHLYGLIPYDQDPRISDKWIENLNKLKVSKNLKYTIAKFSQTWQYFNLSLKSVEEEIVKENRSDVYLMKIYCSLPGIGKKAAMILINELGDTSQFSNEEKLFSYAGVTPRENSSGEHRRQGHITKQGKPILRRILVQAAWVAIRKDTSLNEIFEKIANRKGKKIAIIAIARILLSRLRSCLKRGSEYLKKIDKKEVGCLEPTSNNQRVM